MRRDAAGRPVDEAGDRASEEVNVPISDRSGGARPRRRLRWKQRAQEHPGAVLGPEPLLRPEDLAAAEENVQGIEELVPKILTRSAVKKPKAEDVRQHCVTHVPYQPWCPTCVSGRGLARPHHQGAQIDAEVSQISRVVWDWAFLRDRVGAPLLSVLVGIDHRTSLRAAIVCTDRRATNAETIDAVLTALRRMGHHGTLELRSDGEPALMELLRNVAAKRKAQTVVKRSAPSDSQSNGRIERTVRSVEEATRVLKIDLEHRAKATVSMQDAICT